MFKAFEDSQSITSSLVFLLTTLLVILLVKRLWKSLQTPGPWGVPILGYYPFLRKDFHVQLHELSQKHGEAYTINIAGQSFLYIGTLKGMKEAHVNKIDDFPSRGHKHSVLQYPLENGLAFLEGDQWRLQRKFFVRSMREAGLNPNKEELHGPIAEAVYAALEALYKSKAEVVNASSLMYKECCNVVLRVMLGDSLSKDTVSKLNDTYMRILTPMFGINLLFVGPISRHFILPRRKGYKDMIVATKEMTKMLYKILEDHKKTFDLNQPARDFIDFYLREREMREKKGDPQAKHFTGDTTVLGVPVAKGTITLLNFTAIHNDPDAYKDAKTVDIKRFLPEKGKIESPVTFGIGKRACAGEALVMTEIFLFVTAILQNFIIEPEKIGETDPLSFDMEVMIKAIPRSKGRYGQLVDTSR